MTAGRALAATATALSSAAPLGLSAAGGTGCAGGVPPVVAARLAHAGDPRLPSLGGARP